MSSSAVSSLVTSDRVPLAYERRGTMATTKRQRAVSTLRLFRDGSRNRFMVNLSFGAFLVV
jgi:hypothetical protein